MKLVTGTSMYNHGFATLALAEYYGLTNDAKIGPALKSDPDCFSPKTNPKGLEIQSRK